MAIATCTECGAPLGRSARCDHGRAAAAAPPPRPGGLPTSAKPAAPAGGLAVVPPGAPASAPPPATREAAKAEVAAALQKAGYSAAEAEELAENAIAKAQAAAQGTKA